MSVDAGCRVTDKTSLHLDYEAACWAEKNQLPEEHTWNSLQIQGDGLGLKLCVGCKRERLWLGLGLEGRIGVSGWGTGCWDSLVPTAAGHAQPSMETMFF